MKKGNEASPSIILAGRALLVNMLITIQPRYAFGSNFENFYFLIFFFFIHFLSIFLSVFIHINFFYLFLFSSSFFLLVLNTYVV